MMQRAIIQANTSNRQNIAAAYHSYNKYSK